MQIDDPKMTRAHLGTDLIPSSGTAGKPAPASTDDAFDALMRFGILMWRAGNTAIRTQEWMEVMARKMGFEAVAAGLSLESITVSTRRANGLTTMSMRAITRCARFLLSVCSHWRQIACVWF
jgi:hypothetical protein